MVYMFGPYLNCIQIYLLGFVFYVCIVFQCLCFSLRFQRGSVVRTLVFGWRTFPDLCLIYGW